MTRQAILAIVIGIIIVLGAAAAFLYTKIQQTPDESSAITTQEKAETENGMMATSVADLLKNQENTRCTFNSPTEAGDTSGTIYISGENMRGDFETTTEDETEASHMIRNGDTFYMWGDGLDTGIKMVMSVDEWAQSAEETESSQTPQAIDPNTEVDFQCSAWTVDSSLFSTPTDIEFTSFEGFMGPTGAMTDETETPNTTGGSNNQDQCSICNALTGDAKNVCLQQFNCQ